MERKFCYYVTKEEVPCCVGEYLRKKGYSRQILIHLKKTYRGILVNGEWAYVRTALHAGDRVETLLTEEASSQKIIPVPLPFSIVYQDQDLMVIDKPANMPVHPSINNYDNTLANAAAHYFQSRGEEFVFRCINRLDRDTTGLLILAKNALSASLLSSQMKDRQIHRTYLAVTAGVPEPRTGTINAPIGRKPDSAIERWVDFEHGEQAVTHYQVLHSCPSCSLVQLSLETGRTHQIRVHMKSIGCPLLGDYLYYPDFSLIGRVALHSSQLSFAHPITKEMLHFTAPLPKDMAGLFPRDA